MYQYFKDNDSKKHILMENLLVWVKALDCCSSIQKSVLLTKNLNFVSVTNIELIDETMKYTFVWQQRKGSFVYTFCVSGYKGVNSECYEK